MRSPPKPVKPNITLASDGELVKRWSEYFNHIEGQKGAISAADALNDSDRILEVNLSDVLFSSHEGLGRQIEAQPENALKIGQQVLKKHPSAQQGPIEVTLVNTTPGILYPVGKQSPDHEGELVVMEGSVRRVSMELLKWVRLVYVCPTCGEELIHEPNVLVKLPKPPKCPNCDVRVLFQEGRSERLPYQQATITPGMSSEDSQNPNLRHTVALMGHLTHQLNVGDEVVLTGWLRSKPKGRTGGMEQVLMVCGIDKKGVVEKKLTPSPDELQTWHDATEHELFEDWVIDALVPSFHGFDTERLALALTLFSSNYRKRERGHIHAFLVGDPGLGKSYIMRCASQSAPKGVLVDAKHASGVGLTATVVRDESGEWVLQAGAIPLANDGVCCIDELDKAAKEDVDALHEVMEQQTISIAKAGISQQIPAKTNIIAAANPKEGRWDPHQTPASQLDLAPSLLTRFDAILMFGGQLDDDVYERISEARQRDGVKRGNPLSSDLIRKVAWFARTKIRPKLPPNVLDHITKAVAKMRKSADQSSLPITPRMEQSIERFAVARARLYLRSEVTMEDADWAAEFTEAWLKRITGGDIIKMDWLENPAKASQQQRVAVVMEVLELLLNGSERPAVRESDLMAALADRGYKNQQDVRTILSKLKHEGTIYEPSGGHIAIP